MSGLRCRPGDLALYVGHHAPLQGCLFRCVRYVGDQLGHFRGTKGIGRLMWEVEPLSAAGADVGYVADAALRPLRGEPTAEPRIHEEPAPCLT